jgi:DNA-binding XRE family transcriptional regulator
MKTLRESDVVRVMREVAAERLAELAKDVDVLYKTKDGTEQNVLSPELKLKHRKSGLLYTIDSVGARDAILRTPTGDKFLVDGSELEADYELD